MRNEEDEDMKVKRVMCGLTNGQKQSVLWRIKAALMQDVCVIKANCTCCYLCYTCSWRNNVYKQATICRLLESSSM